MEKLLLGVHVITQNEEECLAECLNSVKSIADEIIVVDTGSTDRTVEIAKSFGVTIVKMKWENDFSQARNLALSYARTEWILCIDADEALAAGADRMRQVLEHSDAEAFFVEVDNILGNRKEDRLRHQAVRLFRMTSDYRFRGRVHEQIIPSILEKHPLDKIKASPLIIVHYGYLPSLLQRKNKISRNFQLLQLSVNENPEDPFHLYNLGVTYCQTGNLDEAERYMKKAYDLAPIAASYRPTLIRDRTKVLLALNRTEETEKLLRLEIARYDDYPDLHHLLGKTLEQQGFFIEAMQSFQKAVRCGAAPDRYVTEAGMGTFRSLHEMASMAQQLGEMEKAHQLYRQALALHPEYLPAISGYAESMRLAGHPDEKIVQQLKTVTADAFFLSKIMCEIGAYSNALSLVNSIETPSFERELLRCECLMQTGQLEEAYRKIGRLLETADEIKRASLVQDRALCRWSEERNLPFSFYKDLSREEQQMYELIDRWLLDGAPPDPIVELPAQHLITRAIQLKVIRVADKLSRMSSALFLAYAKDLYQHGFVLPAADCLLQLMKNGLLDHSGLFMLAELLYDRGHHQQAAALFEQLLKEAPDFEAARIAAALCYLEMAHSAAIEGLRRFPGHPALQTDLERIKNSKKMLNATKWHTSWSCAQRRNLDASADDFAVYDR